LRLRATAKLTLEMTDSTIHAASHPLYVQEGHLIVGLGALGILRTPIVPASFNMDVKTLSRYIMGFRPWSRIFVFALIGDSSATLMFLAVKPYL